MARKNDPVEALALARVIERTRTRWYIDMKITCGLDLHLARAAIAHLSKPTEREVMRQHVKQLNRDTRAKPKRGAKRG